MKKRMLIFFLVSGIILPARGQDASFFANGYLVNQNDTAICKIWFNPKMPFFKDEVIIWQNEESKTILLNDSTTITAFGITDPGYEIDYDRIYIKPLRTYRFAIRLADGVLRVYVLPVIETGQKPDSYALSFEPAGAYFLRRMDDPNNTIPTQIKSLKKKLISKFLSDYPGVDELPDNLSNTQLVEVANKYNAWYTSKLK